MVLPRSNCVMMIALLSWFRVRIIASVPGAHTGKNMHKWGHMKLRKVSMHSNYDTGCQSLEDGVLSFR